MIKNKLLYYLGLPVLFNNLQGKQIVYNCRQHNSVFISFLYFNGYMFRDLR